MNNFETPGNQDFSAEKKPETRLENKNKNIFEISAEEVEKIEELASSEVKEELAVFQESVDEISEEELEGSEKEKTGKLKRKFALALVALTTFAITNGALAEKAEAFNLRINIGVPVTVQQQEVYCEPVIIGTTNVMDQFGNITNMNIVQNVCRNVNVITENTIVFRGSIGGNNHRQQQPVNHRGLRR